MTRTGWPAPMATPAARTTLAASGVSSGEGWVDTSRSALPHGGHGLQSEDVAHPPEPGDDPPAHLSNQVSLPEVLPRGRIGEVDLDHGNVDGGDGIANGHARVRIPPRVDHDGVGPRPGVLDGIDQLPFEVRLDGSDLHTEPIGPVLDPPVDLPQRERAVDLGLPLPEEVEVRAVEHQDLHEVASVCTGVRGADRGASSSSKMAAAVAASTPSRRAQPPSAGTTKIGRPARRFLSAVIAAITSSAVRASGGRVGRPNPDRSSPSRGARPGGVTPVASPRLAAAINPMATASPWETRKPLADSTAWAKVCPRLSEARIERSSGSAET